MTQDKKRTKRRARLKRCELDDVLTSIVAGCPNPSRMVELYYWSQEPGLLDIIRVIAGLDPATRGVVEAFVAMARDPRSVTASLDGTGQLTLAAPEIAQAMAIAEYVAERGEEVPQLLS